jgi:hypothetical protein
MKKFEITVVIETTDDFKPDDLVIRDHIFLDGFEIFTEESDQQAIESIVSKAMSIKEVRLPQFKK